MKTLKDSLEILEQFFASGEPVSVGEVTERSNYPNSKVSRIFAVFRDFGYLTQDPNTRRYKIGYKAFVLGALYA
ncbi:MAG: helix-turn-helix domain-containing protein [Phyllobacteriaceae bacterium]|jgi:DNA-binding IclR family transcriptional regulator|nr:helix-turn-helix domain-containing protein [Phyllobacteriaceae bacterium]